MRLVATGASGNVGTALLRRLATCDHELVAVARRPPPPAAPYDGAHWLSADLSEPRSEPVLAEASAVLRPRRVASELTRWVRRGRISERRLP